MDFHSETCSEKLSMRYGHFYPLERPQMSGKCIYRLCIDLVISRPEHIFRTQTFFSIKVEVKTEDTITHTTNNFYSY